MRIVRNRYGFSPVDVQQQAAASESLESFKLEKLEPSITNLGESKLTARKADLILGLFSPNLHDMTTHKGYDIKILRDNYRSLSVMRNRFGTPNLTVGLYFNGAVNYFEELPKADELKQIPGLYTDYSAGKVGPAKSIQKRLIL